MGVVNQIIDLDNSSKPLPYKSADAFICRGGACSSRKPFRPTPPTAKQIDSSVGYGIYDVPRMPGVTMIENVR